MRILIVDTCYPAFLDAHYASDPGLDSRPYAEQWRALMGTFFGTADSYSHNLAKLGHDAHEVVVNCEPLQRAWAVEHGIGQRSLIRRLFSRGVDAELVLAQAEDYRPDVVYVQNLSALSPATLRRLRQQSRLLVGQIASEAPDEAQLGPFELLLTSFPHFVPRFREQGIPSEYLRIGFDPRVLSHLAVDTPTEDVVFIGALGRAQHNRGNELLERAAHDVPIAFWGYNLEGWDDSSPMRSRYRGEAWGLEMYRVLAGSRIALNRHIDVAEDYANNMRLYEATGVGALLLTDAKRNLHELFEPGVEVVIYEDEAELTRLVRHYLAHEADRSAIAAAGQARTLAEHTYEHRMAELVPILANYAR